MNEPFLTAELEEVVQDGEKYVPFEWTAKCLEELARQLTVSNDYYYILTGAAEMLRTATAALTKISTADT